MLSAATHNLNTNFFDFDWLVMMKKLLKWLVVGARIGLGVLFIYAGIQKFNPKPRPQSTTPDSELPAHVVKIKGLIGGMKQTGYFWEMVGVAEITCGVLLVSQLFALLGAVMLVPITLNIFFFMPFYSRMIKVSCC